MLGNVAVAENAAVDQVCCVRFAPTRALSSTLDLGPLSQDACLLVLMNAYRHRCWLSGGSKAQGQQRICYCSASSLAACILPAPAV